MKVGIFIEDQTRSLTMAVRRTPNPENTKPRTLDRELKTLTHRRLCFLLFSCKTERLKTSRQCMTGRWEEATANASTDCGLHVRSLGLRV